MSLSRDSFISSGSVDVAGFGYAGILLNRLKSLNSLNYLLDFVSNSGLLKGLCSLCEFLFEFVLGLVRPFLVDVFFP